MRICVVTVCMNVNINYEITFRYTKQSFILHLTSCRVAVTYQYLSLRDLPNMIEIDSTRIEIEKQDSLCDDNQVFKVALTFSLSGSCLP